jgi:predicted RNA binding protein YcfA (HicA-like mRNA interferase family)
MRYREIAKKLRKLGCEEVDRGGGGSHRTWLNPETDELASIPDWGRKDVKLGTLRGAIRRLGLDWEEFKKL